MGQVEGEGIRSCNCKEENKKVFFVLCTGESGQEFGQSYLKFGQMRRTYFKFFIIFYLAKINAFFECVNCKSLVTPREL